jgi:hypothetical protein
VIDFDGISRILIHDVVDGGEQLVERSQEAVARSVVTATTPLPILPSL